MKKIIFLIISSFFCMSVMGQTLTSNAFNAKVPTGAKKINGEQLSKYLNKNYKISGVSLDKENTYQVDGLLISYWSLSVNPDYTRTLQDAQEEMLGLLKRNEKNIVNYSKIVTINDIQFLIYEYQKDDEVYLRFQSDFNKDNKNINGIVQFKKPDEDKANKVLQSFLESVHFKE